MPSGKYSINEVGENVAVIANEMKNLSKNFEDFKCDQKKLGEDLKIKVNNNENEIVSLKTKTGNLAIFQSVFSIIIGAIATYLGANKK
jgi:hypothetical protein